MNMSMSTDTQVIPAAASTAAGEVYVFGEHATKGDVIFQMNQYIPQNEFGLPTFFLRGDLLPHGQITQEEVDAAAVDLTYYEGYPCLPRGGAFWNQLPHEPQEMFECFVQYLEQAADIGIRQLDLLAVQLGKDLGRIAEASKEFYWSIRARAYDMFIVAAEAKKRQHRVRKMENNHFADSGHLLTKLMDRFSGDNEDWIDELNAKEAIEAMESLIKIQRMSVGLVGQQASSTSKEFGEGDSTETIIRRLAQGSGANASRSDRFASQLQALLDNPEQGELLQQAILTFTAPDNRTSVADDM